MSDAAFYAVADERYFLGVVALVNSLRLLGHSEPLYLCDCGLKAEQRALLRPHAILVPPAEDLPPWLSKAMAPLAHPADVMILIDADMIVTRRLDELLDVARTGSIAAFENDRDRFVPEWGELLDLGPLTRRPYMSSALLAMPREQGTQVLELLADRQRHVDFSKTYWRENVAGYPYLFADQCVLNAILMSARVDSSRVVTLPRALAPTPPFAGVRLADASRLSCSYADGSQPFVIHHFTAKPWLTPTHDGVYSRLMRRLLGGSDTAVRVPRDWIPRRLRSGPAAFLAQRLVDVREQWRWRVADPLRARRQKEA